MENTIQTYLLKKYKHVLTSKDVNILIGNMGMSTSATSWDDEYINGMAQLMIKAKNEKEIQEESVFDDEPLPAANKRDSKAILRDISK